MSLLTAAEQRRRTTLRRLLLAVGALVVVVASTVVLTLLFVDAAPVSVTTAPDARKNTDPSVPPEPGTGTWTMPPVSAGPLILPRPTGTRQGVPVEFPHSTEGAISAAAHYAEASVTLDVERARTLGEVAGAPAYLDAPRDFVQAVRSARLGLGLSPDGAAKGAYLTFEAQAYRITDATPVRVDVAVVGRVDGAGPATQGQGHGGVTATSYTLVWVDGDWHLAGDGTPLSGPAPAPRTPRAYAEGWRDLAMG
jgi:hypothetical protein